MYIASLIPHYWMNYACWSMQLCIIYFYCISLIFHSYYTEWNAMIYSFIVLLVDIWQTFFWLIKTWTLRSIMYLLTTLWSLLTLVLYSQWLVHCLPYCLLTKITPQESSLCKKWKMSYSKKYILNIELHINCWVPHQAFPLGISGSWYLYLLYSTWH